MHSGGIGSVFYTMETVRVALSQWASSPKNSAIYLAGTKVRPSIMVGKPMLFGNSSSICMVRVRPSGAMRVTVRVVLLKDTVAPRLSASTRSGTMARLCTGQINGATSPA